MFFKLNYKLLIPISFSKKKTLNTYLQKKKPKTLNLKS